MNKFKKGILAGLSILGLTAASVDVQAKPVETKKTEKIYRSNANTSVNYAKTVVNGKDYDEGVSFEAGAEANFDVKPWIKLNSKLSFNYQSLGALEENASETIMDLDLSLEGRIKLFSSKGVSLYAGIGAEYLMHRDFMIHTGSDAHRLMHAAGPRIVAGLDYKYVDVALSFSELFGYRDSSYDRGRTLRHEKAALTVTPRYWRFEMPVTYEFHHWELADYLDDYSHLKHRLNFKPGFDITKYLAGFVNLTFTESPEGDGNAHSTEAGAGVKLKW
jgi:hypothetical protein